MVTTTVQVPLVGALAVTRVALGLGVGLLIADRLDPDRRRLVGGVLLAAGVLSTGPLAWSFVRGIDEGSA